MKALVKASAAPGMEMCEVPADRVPDSNPTVDLSPVTTHRQQLAKFDEATKLLESGEASRNLLQVAGGE